MQVLSGVTSGVTIGFGRGLAFRRGIRRFLPVFLVLAVWQVAGGTVAVAAESEAVPAGVTRYVRFSDDSGTHGGILDGETIRVLDGDPIFDDGVSATGRSVALGDVALELPIDPDRVPRVFGVAVNSNNPDGAPVEVEPVVGQREKEPGRVPASHLEAVESRQRLLDGDQHVEPGVARSGRRQRIDLGGGTEPIPANRPFRIRQGAGGAQTSLERRVPENEPTRVQSCLEAVEAGSDRLQGLGDLGAESGTPHEEPHGRPTPELPVPARECRSTPARRRGPPVAVRPLGLASRALDLPADRPQVPEQRRRVERRSRMGAHQDADDPAHAR